MKNFKKMKFVFFVFAFGTVLGSCSSYNNIQYRNEKQVANKPVKQVEKEQLAESPIQVETETEIALVPTDNETLEDLSIVKEDESLILADNSSKKKSFTESLANKLASKSRLANLIEKIADEQVKSTIKTSDKPEKSKLRKHYDLFFWIMVGLTIIVAILMIYGTYIAFLGINPLYLMIPAFGLFMIGFILLILLNFVLPSKMTDAEKDQPFHRKKSFSLLTFILACIPLGALLVIGISYLLSYAQ